MDTQPRRIEAIDGWRTISVAFVIASHLVNFSSAKLTGVDLVSVAVVGLTRGLANLGVEIFFVISGFVIYRGFIAERERAGRVSLAAFYIRRSLRIIPPLALYVATLCILAGLGIVNSGAIWATQALTFTCNIPNAYCGGWLGGHTWSLSFEEQFYLLAPLLFSALFPHRTGALGLAVAGLAALSITASILHHNYISEFIGRFYFIAVGCLAAMNEPLLRRWIKRGGRLVTPLAVLAILALSYVQFEHYTGFGEVALALLVAAALLATSEPTSRLGSILSATPLRLLGRASYEIYLWQQLATYQFPGAGPVFYAATVSACVLLSLGLYRAVDLPLIRLGRDLSGRLSTRATPQPEPRPAS